MSENSIIIDDLTPEQIRQNVEINQQFIYNKEVKTQTDIKTKDLSDLDLRIVNILKESLSPLNTAQIHYRLNDRSVNQKQVTNKLWSLAKKQIISKSEGRGYYQYSK